MTLQQLKAFGCNTDEGLQRCLNNETFYLGLVNKFVTSIDLSNLRKALANKDLETAFKEVHSLKGVAGNLALTPIFDVTVKMVEPLRVKQDIDYTSLFNQLESLVNELKAM